MVNSHICPWSMQEKSYLLLIKYLFSPNLPWKCTLRIIYALEACIKRHIYLVSMHEGSYLPMEYFRSIIFDRRYFNYEGLVWSFMYMSEADMDPKIFQGQIIFALKIYMENHICHWSVFGPISFMHTIRVNLTLHMYLRGRYDLLCTIIG